MEPIQLFDLASRQAQWLSVRQEVVATNIANANTPKFRAKDVTPFDSELKSASAGMAMARTQPGHMEASIIGNGKVEIDEPDVNNEIGTQESGNTVALSTEVAKMGEVKRQFELNTQLIRAMQNMMLTAVGK
ncbi:flagellar basal body rod protein FlgB [Rhizobium daejeonense]|uniref:Flagellar basal body rod protein FlgB n=1 Tax=Rhizobium daejeonense TaxID=240521 RepID=A0A6M1S5L4_9HYPH|nr:flagellar basal body rod protein FlgB [Rhizobium daejeonense]NGO64607.1 flagellar basal body rod protein FlgB [Rhizobium daejeonense]